MQYPVWVAAFVKMLKKSVKNGRGERVSNDSIDSLNSLLYSPLSPFSGNAIKLSDCDIISRLFRVISMLFSHEFVEKKGWIQSDLIRIFSLSKNDLRIEYQAELADPLVHALFCWVEIFTGDPSFYQFWCCHIFE